MLPGTQVGIGQKDGADQGLLCPSDDNLTLLIPSSQVLGEAMTGISQNAKNGNLPEFGEAISTASKALCGFTEAAAQVILRRSLERPAFLSPPHSLTHL